MRKPELLGLGIDLLSLKRARLFVKDHSVSRINRWLAPSESLVGSKKRFPAARFARFLTAKEAFAKAVDFPILSPQDFRAIQVKLLPHDRFKVEFTRPGKLRYEAEGCFFRSGQYIGAQVTLWK